VLLDVSAITKTLLNVLRAAIPASPVWPGGQVLNTSPHPPDKLSGPNTVGLYLYHVAEDAATKNVPPMRSAPPDLRFTPMGLNLFYVLRAFSDLEDESTYREQLIMGLAVKALRDYPTIDDETRVNGATVLDVDLQKKENRLRIVLQPVPPSEAVSYWTAGQAPIRLAAYYQVSIVLLESDDVDLRIGRVLDYGVFSFLGLGPRLDSSASEVGFTTPDGVARTVKAVPAQAAAGQQVEFLGSGFTGGRVGLAIRGPRWANFVEVDATWGVVATTDRVLTTVQPLANGTPVPPGVYEASVILTRRIVEPDGRVRDVAATSNVTPFTVIPGVTNVVAAGPPSTQFAVMGSGFTPAAAVEVYVGAERLVPHALPLADGQFHIDGDKKITLRLPAGLASGSTPPLRILVNGATAPPWWVKVP
jgi:hypothetical protein